MAKHFSNRYAMHKHSQAQNIIFQVYNSHLWVHLSAGSAFPQPDQNDKLLRYFFLHHNNNFKIFSCISSHEIPPQSACKCFCSLNSNLALPQCLHKTYLLFSLKCHPIHPGFHKDPSIGAQTYTVKNEVCKAH